tara:strand:- start:2499 stop:2855 length:357 start_codon:yes stop_codon:yes gene_type:complete
MVNQMSEQMDVSKKEAGGLMKKAKSMNDAEGMNMGGMMRRPMPAPGMGGYEMRMEDGGLSKGQKALREKNPGVVARMEGVSVDEVMNMADGGMARCQGTPPVQVKGFTYNNNSGKGTF